MSPRAGAPTPFRPQSFGWPIQEVLAFSFFQLSKIVAKAILDKSINRGRAVLGSEFVSVWPISKSLGASRMRLWCLGTPCDPSDSAAARGQPFKDGRA